MSSVRICCVDPLKGRRKKINLATHTLSGYVKCVLSRVIFNQIVLIFITKVQILQTKLPNLFQNSFSVQLAFTLFYSSCTNSSEGHVKKTQVDKKNCGAYFTNGFNSQPASSDSISSCKHIFWYSHRKQGKIRRWTNLLHIIMEYNIAAT